MLNILYIENKNAHIAVKVNNNLSRIIPVKDADIQGSVWTGLKCTSMMDTLNKTVMSDKSLKYFYKEDQNIHIGIKGMVDNTLGISKCGSQAIKPNSFIQSQRLTLSDS